MSANLADIKVVEGVLCECKLQSIFFLFFLSFLLLKLGFNN